LNLDILLFGERIAVVKKSPRKRRYLRSLPSRPLVALHRGLDTWKRQEEQKITKVEMAQFVTSNLRDGYVLTIYPESKSGIFVDMECPVSNNSTLLVFDPV
jgi:hypothetical protein